jgi:hypothetical protein
MEFYDFPSSWEWKIIPTDEFIFFRGVGIPPTSMCIYINIYIYMEYLPTFQKSPGVNIPYIDFFGAE